VFKVGSIGKQFVAAGILILANEGKLSIEDSVRKHLTDAPETWEPVTFRRLLSHTSGIIRADQRQALDRFSRGTHFPPIGNDCHASDIVL